jgi:hypothetical protein
MPSINYPFPDPQNEEERAANRAASDEYDRLENEAADFLDWGQELAGLDGLPQPVRTTTAYSLSLLPETHVNYRAYLLTIALDGGGLWTVTHGAEVYLDADGKWTDAFEDHAPTSDHLFPIADALRLAQQALPHVAVNGITAADVIRGGAR